MTAPDKEWSLAGAALMIHRIPSLGPLAVRHRLNERGDRRAKQLRQMGATLKPPDLAPNQFAPARSNALAHKALQDRLDLDAGRKRCGLHRRLHFADGQGIIYHEAHADVVNGIASSKLAAEMVGSRYCH